MFVTYILQSLKDGRPFKILFTEMAENITQAKKREKYWKSGAGRRKLKSFIKNGFPFANNASVV